LVLNTALPQRLRPKIGRSFSPGRHWTGSTPRCGTLPSTAMRLAAEKFPDEDYHSIFAGEIRFSSASHYPEL
jgi:hypothetical protein